MELRSNMHFIRYGISAEERYFQEFENMIDGIFINGNMVAHMPGALSKFIGEKIINKPYLIDPLTHAFQHDISHLMSENKNGEKKIKNSIMKMIDAYGEPVKSCITSYRVLQPHDFSSDQTIDQFARSVCEFQLNSLHKESPELSEYYEYAGIKSPLQPKYIIAPYFYMDSSSWNEWLQVNVMLIESAIRQFPSKEICAQIVISKDLLANQSAIREIIYKYSFLQVSGFALWIDDFDEHESSAHELKSYINMLNLLGKIAPIMILYGSFFSVALMKYCKHLNIKAVGHGLEYGESRSVVPVGGGIPVSKFYYPSLHARIRFNEAFILARQYLEQGKESYLLNVCDCQMCKEVMNSSQTALEAFGLYGESKPITFRRKNQVVTLDYPEQETRDRCVRHYLFKKNDEYRNTESLESVLVELESMYNKYKLLTGTRFLKHCINWKTSLEYAQSLGRHYET